MNAISMIDAAIPAERYVPDLVLKVVRTEGALLALQNEWEALENICEGATLFQSFAWCRLAAQMAEKTGAGGLFVCCVYAEGRLIGLLPLKVLKKRYYSVLTGLAEPFQEFTEMLVAPEYSPVDVFGTIFAELAQSGADFVHLGQVRTDSCLYSAVEGKIPATGETDAAPFVKLDQWDSFEPFLKTVKTKTRKNMRNQRNVLERTEPVTHDVVERGEELDQIIDRTYANRAQWLGEKGLTSAAFSDDQFQTFLDSFKSGSKSGVESIGMSFRHGDKFLAEQWGFIHRGRYYAFISSYNEEYARLSPGKLHLGEIVKMGFDRKLKTMEFMLPDVPYKRVWAKETIQVQDHILGFSAKGKLYAGLWVNIVRPRVKRLALSLPESLRRMLIATVYGR